MIEIFFIIGFILLAISFLVQALDLNFLLPNGLISSGYFPTIYSVILLALLLVYLIRLIYKRRLEENNGDKSRTPKTVIFNQVFTVVMISFAVYIVQFIGMLPTLGIYIMITLIVVEKLSWIRSLIFSVCSMLVVHVVFVVWLNMNLPQGIFI